MAQLPHFCLAASPSLVVILALLSEPQVEHTVDRRIQDAAPAQSDAAWEAECQRVYEMWSRNLPEAAGAQCDALNALEAEADAVVHLSTPAVVKFETALAHWRSLGLEEQPACRLRALGESLCAAMGGALSEGLCRCYAAWYFPKRLPPAFFWFPEEWFDNVSAAQEWLVEPDYSERLTEAGHRAPPYGPPQVPWHNFSQGRLRLQRMMSLHVLQIMLSARPDTELSGITQVVEFGTGTGDLPAALFDLNFNGTVLVHDFKPMLQGALYWHRYSGIPSYLGESLLQAPRAAQGRIVLEHTLPGLLAHLDEAQLRDSVFLAIFSLTEADLGTRRKWEPWVKQFGTIVFGFAAAYSGPATRGEVVDNLAYMKGLLQMLSPTHHVLTWRAPQLKDGAHFWLVGSWRGHGQLQCRRPIDCSESALCPELSG